MIEADVYAGLTRVFRDVLDNETLTIGPTSNPADVPGWDSMAFVNLVVGTEAEFSVEFTTAEIDGIKRVGDLAALILAKKRQA